MLKGPLGALGIVALIIGVAILATKPPPPEDWRVTRGRTLVEAAKAARDEALLQEIADRRAKMKKAQGEALLQKIADCEAAILAGQAMMNIISDSDVGDLLINGGEPLKGYYVLVTIVEELKALLVKLRRRVELEVEPIRPKAWSLEAWRAGR